MPYIASNQDVNKQDNWSGLLVAAGVVAGAAAIGGAISGSKGMKAMKQRYDKDDVVKGLYGKKAKGIYASKKGWANINARNFKLDEEGKELLGNAPRFQAGRSITGKHKMYRTDGNPFQRAYTNWKDKDLRMFNKELRQLQKGSNLGPDDIYSRSKLSLYENLGSKSKNLNTNTEELTKLTKGVFDSNNVKAVREAHPLAGTFDDMSITNKVWGDLYGGNMDGIEKYNYVEREAVNKKLAEAGPPKFDSSMALPETSSVGYGPVAPTVPREAPVAPNAETTKRSKGESRLSRNRKKNRQSRNKNTNRQSRSRKNKKDRRR